MSKYRGFRFAALCAAIAWCLLFARAETTDKSMIRAVFLQRGADSWQAGFLYQSPEPSADASEAAAEVAFTAAEGLTLEQALSAAERTLPQTANYRLCDHVFVGEGGYAPLEEYENLLLTDQCGRLASRVLMCDFTFEELSSASEEISDLPKALLQCAKQSADISPRLYESADGLLLPVLELTENGASQKESGVLLAGGGEYQLNSNGLNAALALSGKGKDLTFTLNGIAVKLARAVCSLTVQSEGFVLRVDCLSAPAAQKPTDEQIEQLETLFSDTIELFWQNGVDILNLGAARALKYGAAEKTEPTKDECPDVNVIACVL